MHGAAAVFSVIRGEINGFGATERYLEKLGLSGGEARENSFIRATYPWTKLEAGVYLSKGDLRARDFCGEAEGRISALARAQTDDRPIVSFTITRGNDRRKSTCCVLRGAAKFCARPVRAKERN